MENAEILIENDLMEYKNRYFFESVKIIASNINISHKKNNRYQMVSVIFWCECSYRIWQNTVLPVAEHHIQTIIRTFAIFLCFSYNELTEIKEVLI